MLLAGAEGLGMAEVGAVLRAGPNQTPLVAPVVDPLVPVHVLGQPAHQLLLEQGLAGSVHPAQRHRVALAHQQRCAPVRVRHEAAHFRAARQQVRASAPVLGVQRRDVDPALGVGPGHLGAPVRRRREHHRAVVGPASAALEQNAVGRDVDRAHAHPLRQTAAASRWRGAGRLGRQRGGAGERRLGGRGAGQGCDRGRQVLDAEAPQAEGQVNGDGGEGLRGGLRQVPRAGQRGAQARGEGDGDENQGEKSQGVAPEYPVGMRSCCPNPSSLEPAHRQTPSPFSPAPASIARCRLTLGPELRRREGWPGRTPTAHPNGA